MSKARRACRGGVAGGGSKEERRRLALQKLARVFGQRQSPQDRTAAERRVLREVLRRTDQRDVADLVQSRLDVLQVDATRWGGRVRTKTLACTTRIVASLGQGFGALGFARDDAAEL